MSLKYLTRRTALSATTKNPSLTNFNHLRSFPRAWLVRQSKHDPKLKSVRPLDRIKYWNIVPGDQIRLRGDPEATIREVLSINRLSNRVFVKGSSTDATKDGQPPPSKNYHYSKCQLYIGEREAISPDDRTGPPQWLPVFAVRVNTSAPVWDHFFKRWSWRRYAVATTPRLPGWMRGNRLRIPWPADEKRIYPEPAAYDTPRDEVAKITYELPNFAPNRGGAVPELPSENLYLDYIYNPALGTAYDPSQPFEVYLSKELSNPHSRSKKMERFQAHQAREKDTYSRILLEEEQHRDGRTSRQIKADAAFKFRELVKTEKTEKKKARWMHSAHAAEKDRKANKKVKKEERLRRRLNELVLVDEPNQVVPKSLEA